jgi:hypothetical protein
MKNNKSKTLNGVIFGLMVLSLAVLSPKKAEAVVLDEGGRAVEVLEPEKLQGDFLRQKFSSHSSQTRSTEEVGNFDLDEQSRSQLAGRAGNFSNSLNNPAFWLLTLVAFMVGLSWADLKER